MSTAPGRVCASRCAMVTRSGDQAARFWDRTAQFVDEFGIYPTGQPALPP